MKITHYDLFAGIGGFSYALDTIFYEQKNEHIFCEWEAFPTAVLKKHWPDATYFGDIADLVADTECKGREGELWQAEGQHRLCDRGGEDKDLTILTGGFPCQPFSHAGRRQGTADDRYKWPEMFAVIRNVRPDWVIAENVRGLVTWNEGMVLETVCADLESEGYEVRPLIIPAVAVGAPHRRDRVWIVAHAKNFNDRGDTRELSQSDEQQAGERQEERTSKLGGTDYGHWKRDWRDVARETCSEARVSALGRIIRRYAIRAGVYRMDDGLPRQMDGVTISAARHRKERLKACGNAIVPQVAMEIFKAIKQVV